MDGWFKEWVEDREGGYEAYEVKNKRQKLRCLLLHRKKKNIFYLFMKSLHGKKFLNGPLFSSITAQSQFCKIYFLGLLDVLHTLYSVKSNDGHAASVVILVFEH